MGKNNKALNLQDLVGTKVRMLTVLRFSHIEQAEQADRIRNKYMYECLCNCGKRTLVNRFHLKQKDSHASTWSCGCYQKSQSLKGHEKQKGKPRPQIQKANGESVLHSMFLAYQGGAKKRDLRFNLTKEEFAELTSLICYYCGSEPREVKKKASDFVSRKMNGIDRLDSSKGYELSNCVSCCKTCNYMKLEMSVSEFLNHIDKIYNKNFL